MFYLEKLLLKMFENASLTTSFTVQANEAVCVVGDTFEW